MTEIDNDDCCFTCWYSIPRNVDEHGNAEYVTCTFLNKDMANDELCQAYKGE